MISLEIVYKTNIHDDVFSHSHKHTEIIYCVTGSSVVKTNKNVVTITKGDFVLIPPGIMHSHRKISKEDCTVIVLIIAGWKVGYDSIFKQRDDENLPLLSLLEQMCFYSYIYIENKSVILHSFLELILNILTAVSQLEKYSQYTAKILNSINSNFSNPAYCLLEELKSIPQNVNYMRRKFIAETGVSPSEYLTKTRIDFAKKLLPKRHLTGYTIKEIAELSGFTDPLYFSRVFKKKTGLPPTEYSPE